MSQCDREINLDKMKYELVKYSTKKMKWSWLNGKYKRKLKKTICNSTFS